MAQHFVLRIGRVLPTITTRRYWLGQNASTMVGVTSLKNMASDFVGVGAITFTDVQAPSVRAWATCIRSSIPRADIQLDTIQYAERNI